MKKAFLISLILILLVVLVACSSLSNNTFASFDYFATVITLYSSTSNDVAVNTAWSDIKEDINTIEKTVSVYIEDSDIYKFNAAPQNTTIEISLLTYNILSLAKEAYENTNGAYNPAMLLLSDLWGFTDRFTHLDYEPEKTYDRQNPQTELPNSEYVEGFLTLSDFSKVVLSTQDDKYFVFKPDVSIEIDGIIYTMQLDLGGIVKGFATGRITKILKSYNVEYGYTTLGSSSITLFERNKKGTKWDLSLKDPLDASNFYLKTPLSSAYISTSGNYEQYYEIGSTRYCHIINPFTGTPIQNGNLSATCIYPFNYLDDEKAGSLLDAYSTALMVMNLEDAKQFIKDKKLTAYIALKDGDINKVYTNDLNARIMGDYQKI